MARLRIEFRGAATVVSLAHGETTVGRSNRCTIHLPDPGLAPVHFRIREKAKGFQLKDDGSGIGTHVNGKPVFATTLKHGDWIEAGGLRCQYLAEADAAAPAPPPRAAPPPASRGRWIWIAAAAAAGILLGAVFLLLSGSREKEAVALWREAGEHLALSRTDPAAAAEHLEAAAERLRRLGDAYPEARLAGTAALALEDAEAALAALARVDEERRRLRPEIPEEEAQDTFLRLAKLKEGAHPAVAARVEALEEQVKQARVARAERRFADARAQAEEHAAGRRFADALRVWQSFETPDYLYRQRADRELDALEGKVAEEYRALLKLAGRGADLDAQIGLLESSRPVFAGTPHAEDLEVRIGALRARRSPPRVTVAEERRRPETPEAKEPEQPEPLPEAAPYEDPPRVVALVRARRYAEAASLLHAITRHPDAEVRVEELTLLANLMADLVGAVRARPGDFTQVLLPEGAGRADALGADERALHVRGDGGEAQVTWDALPAKSFVRLFRQAGFEKPPRLAVALFFDEEAQPKEAQQAYVAFFKSEQAPETLTRILARRRGIERPAGGFELFRGDLVTEAEKRDVLRKEEIDKLGQQALSTVETRRREAWAQLEQLGEPARETLARVLLARRAQVAGELAQSGAFGPARFAARLGNDLRQRREEALAFILDPNRYPYPDKSEAAQKEAERLVDLVREIYERPYALLLVKSKEAQALDQELRELDERLAKADPLAEPLHEAAVARIQKSLDARMIAIDDRDRKRIDYNVEIAKYNAELKGTSADEEERANVEAVNEYRWMMGLHALKIDERLVRAARKHSIEMRQRDYFAHESPTPELRDPPRRAKREGYGGGVSENIARGASSGKQAFWQWFQSSGHHRNMLVPGHTEMGCGASAHHWWTQLFGRMTGKSLDTPKVPPDPDPPGTSGNGDPPPR